MPVLDHSLRRIDPITYLPSDLVQDIFYSAGPAAYYQDPPVSLVSRKWRRLALETPALWSMIYIRQSGWFMKPSRLQTWLGRIYEQSLEVHLELHSELTTDNVFAVYRVLEPFLERRVNRFYTYEEYNVLHVFGDFSDRLRNAKIISIHGYAESSPLPWRRRMVDLPTPKAGRTSVKMPNLEHLHLCLYPLRAMSAFDAPKLHTLKLECMSIDPQPLLDLVRRSPKLKQLTLHMVVWTKDLDVAEWPWREDDGRDSLPELVYLEIPPISDQKALFNTRVSTRILQMCSRLVELRAEFSSLFDLGSAFHSSGIESLRKLQLTVDVEWGKEAIDLLIANRPSESGLFWLYSFCSLTRLDMIFSHPTGRHSRKKDYDISLLINVLAGEAFSQSKRAPLSGFNQLISNSFPLPRLEHLSLILWDLDPNSIRSFLFCRAPDGPRFVARTSGLQGTSRTNPSFTATACRISLICCTFSDGDSESEVRKKDGIEPSLHQAGYEEFQSFWFYLREK